MNQRGSQGVAAAGEGAERLLDRAIAVLLVVSGAALLLMMLHVSADVVLRYMVGLPIPDTIETASYYYMILVVFLPLAFVERRSEHVEVELLVQVLSARLRNALYVAGRLFAVAVFGLLAYQSWLDAQYYAELRETPMGSALEIWPSRFALPIGFAFMVLALLLHAVKAALAPDAVRPQGPGPAYAAEETP